MFIDHESHIVATDYSADSRAAERRRSLADSRQGRNSRQVGNTGVNGSGRDERRQYAIRFVNKLYRVTPGISRKYCEGDRIGPRLWKCNATNAPAILCARCWPVLSVPQHSTNALRNAATNYSAATVVFASSRLIDTLRNCTRLEAGLNVPLRNPP